MDSFASLTSINTFSFSLNGNNFFTVWLFGGNEIYKNIFSDSKYVEFYHQRDIERELGLERIDYVCLALLLGSDYTTGVHGIGIVNATEIIRVFPGKLKIEN